MPSFRKNCIDFSKAFFSYLGASISDFLPAALLPVLLAAPSLSAQTFQLEAFGHTPATLVTGSVTNKSGVTRKPLGTTATPDGLTTSHPAASVITVTNPVVSDVGTSVPFLGWAPTEYNPVTGYAAAVTTNPLSVTLNADRRLVGYAGYPVAQAINTPERIWTSGGHALWTGTYDVSGPEGGGVARATLLREVGDEAWLESTFTAPTIVSYTWRLDMPTGVQARLEAWVGGNVVETVIAATTPSWKVRTLDLTGTGPVKVRFRLTHTANSTVSQLVDRRESAYVTHVRTGTFAASAHVVASGTSGTAATLGWDAAYAAESYTAELATDDTFSQILFTQNITVPAVACTFGGLTSGATYFYRVLARRTGYKALASATGSFLAAPRATQTLTFPEISAKTLGSVPFSPGATASSALPATYTILDGPAEVENGGLITVTGLGTVTVRAEQAGNHAFEPAPSITRNFSVVVPTGARVTLAATTRIYSGMPQAVLATTMPPGLSVTYSYQSGKAPASAVPPTDVGIYNVTAILNVPGVTSAPAKSTLKILKAPLTVTGVPVERLAGQANPQLNLAYTGFVGDDDQSELDVLPVPTTTARPTSTAGGSYPITFKGGSDNNYNFILGSPPASVNVRGFGKAFEALVLDADLLPTGKLTIAPSQTSMMYTGSLLLAAEAKAIAIAPGRSLIVSTDFTTGTDTVTFNLPATKNASAHSYTLAFTLSSEGTLEGTLLRDNQPYANLAHGRFLPMAQPRTISVLKGSYSLLLPPASSMAELTVTPLPEGAGFATGTITAAGQLTLAGILADGTAFTTSALPDSSNAYRLFIKPYGTRLGQRFGGLLPLTSSLDFTTVPSLRYRTAASAFVWEKPGFAADKSYRPGFGPLVTQANVELWLPPVARVAAKGATPEKPAITLAQRLSLASSSTTDGLFEVTYENSVLTDLQISAQPSSLTLKSIGTVLLPSPNSSGFKLTLKPDTGALTGQFTVTELLLPPAKKPLTRTATFKGILRQGPTADGTLVGQGHFILPALQGATTTEGTSGAISFFVPVTAP